jgi:hypothetical protein
MKAKPIRRISTNFEVSVEDTVIALAHSSGTVYLTEAQLQDVLSSLSIVAKGFASGGREIRVGPGSSKFGVELGSESSAADLDSDRIPVRLRSGAHVWFTCEAWELTALISGLVALQAELNEEFEEQWLGLEEKLRKQLADWGEELEKKRFTVQNEKFKDIRGNFTDKAIFIGMDKSGK